MNLTLNSQLTRLNGVHIQTIRIILYAAHTIWKRVKRIFQNHQPVSTSKCSLVQTMTHTHTHQHERQFQDGIALKQHSSFDFQPFLFLA